MPEEGLAGAALAVDPSYPNGVRCRSLTQRIILIATTLLRALQIGGFVKCLVVSADPSREQFGVGCEPRNLGNVAYVTGA